jgi:hypothetical protein
VLTGTAPFVDDTFADFEQADIGEFFLDEVQ